MARWDTERLVVVHPFVSFGCGDVDIGKREVSSRSARFRALREVAQKWRDERCCPAGGPFNSPFGDRVNADPAGDLGSGSEFVRTREWDAVGFGDAACLRI